MGNKVMELQRTVFGIDEAIRRGPYRLRVPISWAARQDAGLLKVADVVAEGLAWRKGRAPAEHRVLRRWEDWFS